MNFKKLILILIIGFFLFPTCHIYGANSDKKEVVSTKKERNHITKGNSLFNEGKFKQALEEYQSALKENSNSAVARYNLGLTEITIGLNPNDTTEAAKRMLESGTKEMQQIANLGGRRADLASRANYNLGNIAFHSQDYAQAIKYYKQSLRLNPEDDNARRNLRIAQLRLENQEDNQQDQDQEQNEDQDQNQDQNQEQNQDDQNQDQQEDNQDQQDNSDENQENQQPAGIDQQTAEQILNAIENKENQTRARVAGENAEKSRQRNKNPLNW